MRSSLAHALAACASLSLTLLPTAAAVQLDTTSPDSIKSAAKTVAANLMSYYSGNKPGNAPGLLPNSGQANGYGWWEGGEVFGALIDYWSLTGDSQYNALTSQALQFQRGEHNDYNPSNYSQYLGNDDISFWAMAAMTAAETVFPDPPSGDPSWLALVQAVWNEQQALWDTSSCGGGLRWQRQIFSGGYKYKNSITEGTFFQIGARLGKYTGNTTYLDWAEKMFDWTRAVELVDGQYNVWDGASTEQNCSVVSQLAWTYNVGIFMYGSAVMWNATGNDAKWRPIVQGFLTAAAQFMPHTDGDAVQGVMVETACETIATCNIDQLSFKSNLARAFWATAQVAPWTAQQATAYLVPNANAAALACNSAVAGQCGFKWTTGTYDNYPGVGQQINALQIMQGLLHASAPGPVTIKTGGTSQGNPNAGIDPNTAQAGTVLAPLPSGSKAGAGILTAIFVAGTLVRAWWMLR